MASNDFQSRVIRTNQIVNSGSLSTTPMLVYGLGSALDTNGGFAAAHFITGSDTWLFVSGSRLAKGTSTRGVATFGGDVVVSGSIYDINGNPYATAGGSPGGSNTQVQFNDSSTFSGSAGFTFNKASNNVTIAGDLAVNGGDITTTASAATIFSTNITSLSLANVAQDITVGGSINNSSLLNFNLASYRVGDVELNIGTGATGGGWTKTLNLGTGGLGGSATIINLGTVDTVGPTTVNLSGSFHITGTTTTSGSIIPASDVTYTLGTSAKRWAHIYTGDLHLKNDRGDWTIIEENDFLRVRNNKSGKNFKIIMQEINYQDS
jgi:hypothetical protein